MFYQLLLLHRSCPKEAERKLEKTRNAPESLVATACKSVSNSLSGSVKEKRPLIATKQEKDENLGNQNGKYLNQKGSILLPQTKLFYLCVLLQRSNGRCLGLHFRFTETAKSRAKYSKATMKTHSSFLIYLLKTTIPNSRSTTCFCCVLQFLN